MSQDDVKGDSLLGLHPTPNMPPEPPLAGPKASAPQTSYAASAVSSNMQISSSSWSSAAGSPQQQHLQVLIPAAQEDSSPFAMCPYDSQDPAASGMQAAQQSLSNGSGTPAHSYSSQRATNSSSGSGRAQTSDGSGADMLGPLPTRHTCPQGNG